jgi:hypothetical protein
VCEEQQVEQPRRIEVGEVRLGESAEDGCVGGLVAGELERVAVGGVLPTPGAAKSRRSRFCDDPLRWTGGGTWTTSGGSGTYEVTALVSWERANDQVNVGFVHNIDEGMRTNGTAVLKIAFSDGSSGVLTIGCHGPGAPPGIFEGIATTKGYKTYYNVQAPAPGVDANRTIFHVR